MPIFIAIVALMLPRLVIFLLFLFSEWWGQAFDSFIIPLLGFVFLPYTLLWYSVVVNWFDGAWGIWHILFLVLALIADFTSVFSSRNYNER